MFSPDSFVIGKRSPVGAAVGALATVLLYTYFPELPELVKGAIEIVAIAVSQIVVVNWMGVTSDE